MERDKWDELFESTEDALDSLEDIRAMMGTEELGLHGMTWNEEGGFIEVREVRVTEPWRPSLVRLRERPRVQLSVITRRCDHCAKEYTARRASSLYCGGACRIAAMRTRNANVVA